MTNNLLRIKFLQRLNKLASFDYDNIECWQIIEAFNKAQREWFRRQVHGINIRKESAEETNAAIDDIQKFIKSVDLDGVNKKLFFETDVIPTDYAHFIRLSSFADKDDCKNREVTVYLAEEANADLLLTDVLKGPDFDWAETFATMFSDKFKIYTNNKFIITKGVLYYYKKPADIGFDGCIDPSTGQASVDQECEFRDDVTELIIDEAAAILAADIDNFNQYQRELQNSQRSS
jgi:hypothetical protein